MSDPTSKWRVIYRGGFTPDLAVYVDPASQFHLWLFVKHPDGQWVSLAPLRQFIDKEPA